MKQSCFEKNKKYRLAKYISSCGYCSRRHAELLIKAGLVYVNEKKVTDFATKINVEDKVIINGERILPLKKIYLMLNKPAGFISSTHDTHERLTVMDLLPRKLRFLGVRPCGRLDLDTEGLLILTNDGELQHHITHPSNKKEKEYIVMLNKPLTKKVAKKIESGGIPIGNHKSLPCKISYFKDKTVKIILYEGRKREIKLLFKHFSYKVEYLKRIRIGKLILDEKLKKGEYRKLSKKEIEFLYEK